MNRGALGNEGVSAINSFFNRLGYIRSYIANDDTKPIWDGNLFVYNHRDDFSNERLLFTTTIQVKSEEYLTDNFPETTLFEIEILNLHHYLEDGGVVFFKVLVGPEKNQIYIEYLSKTRIENYLRTAKGKSYRTIKLEKIKKNYTEIIRSLRTLHLQRTHNIISFDQLMTYNNIKWIISPYGISSKDNVLEYITTFPTDILAIIDDLSDPFYVGNNAVTLNKVNVNIEVEIPLDEELWTFDGLVTVEGKVRELYIGKSLYFRLIKKEDDETHVDFKIDLKGESLFEILKELKLINKLLNERSLNINGKDIMFPLPVKENDLKYWNAKLTYWQDVEHMFALMKIKEDLKNIQLMSEEEISRLDALIQSYLYGKEIKGTMTKYESHLEIMTISNLNILVFIRHIRNQIFRIESVYERLSACYKTEDGVMLPASIYSKIIAEKPLAHNVDWNKLLEDYKAICNVNPDFYERANWDVLWLIKLFDEHKFDILLTTAEQLLLWIKETDKITDWKNSWELNLMQIKIRKHSELDYKEKEFLYNKEEIILSNKVIEDDQRNQYLFSIYILLKDVYKANRILGRMELQEKIFIQELPIFNLYKQFNT